MLFKHLSSKDKLFIKQTHSDNSVPWQSRMNILTSKFGVQERTLRRWIKELGFSSFAETTSPQIEAAKNRKPTQSKYYIISCAQNATPVHISFFENIKAYADYLSAEIHIIPLRYKNPTSVFVDKDDDYWDECLNEYLSYSRLDLHQGITVAGDVKIQPTATNPLSGFEGLTGDKSTIFGHPRVHLESLPVLEGHPFKFLLTTGAVTLRNYTDSKAGKKGEFHHTFGFVIVEIKDKNTYFVRQVTANDDGSFVDILNHVEDGKVTNEGSVEGYVMGDLHSFQKDEPLYQKTLEYLKILKPKNVILHDPFDGVSISHHERKDPVKKYHKHLSGQDKVSNDIEATLKDINDLLEYNPVVVYSNHSVWLDRWIMDQDWKKEIHNCVEYMKYATALLTKEADNGVLPYIIKERFGDKVRCLKEDESYKICGWEVGCHGHLGANGGRGSIETYRKFNTKIITADSHVSFRRDGAMSVGTHSKRRMGFNKGASSWNNSDAIIHKNGKAQHLIFFNNQCTTLLNNEKSLSNSRQLVKGKV